MPDDLPMPNRCSQNTPEEHYGQIFNAYIKSITNQIRERFEGKKELAQSMKGLLPSVIASTADEELIQEIFVLKTAFLLEFE